MGHGSNNDCNPQVENENIYATEATRGCLGSEPNREGVEKNTQQYYKFGILQTSSELLCGLRKG